MDSQPFFAISEFAYNNVSNYLSNSTRTWTVHHHVYSYVKVIEFLIPRPHRRVQVTKDNALEWLLLASPLLPLAYLVRRQHTCLIRRAMLPFVTALMTRFVFAYRLFPRTETTWNYIQIVCGLCLIARCIEFGWVPNGRRKLSELAPGVPKDPEFAEIVENESLSRAFYRGATDSIEILFNIRGIGYDFGTGSGLTLPEVRKAKDNRIIWIRQTICDIVNNFIWMDLMHTIVKLQPWVPGVGTLTGGSLWSQRLPPLHRSIIATLLHAAVGEIMTNGLSLIYDSCALFSVIVLGHEPTQWPPLFGDTWGSTSVSSYLTTDWHQMLRQTFITCCGFPLQTILGQLGLLLGTCLASGLVHSCALYSNGLPGDKEILYFFLLQALAIIAEASFRKVTGRTVGGFWGSIWVFIIITIGGQQCSDVWARSGILGGQILPDQLSIIRKHLIPKTMQFLEAIEVL
ncbi:hypothetical protein FRC02_007917 [Tulasnella sp. 418]|nr:hypothetical protein FRC02_007917 [Tulasnella sp. 418]